MSAAAGGWLPRSTDVEDGLFERASVASFAASDGYRLKYRTWAARGPLRGCVVGLHGIQSHSGWYPFSSAALSAAGFDVHFLDRRGAGLNGRERGHAAHADRLVGDVTQFLEHARRTTDPAVPLILLSVSWAGRLAAVIAARRPRLIDGLALLYPGICARVRPTRWQRGLLRLALSTGHDRDRIPIPLADSRLFSGERYWQERIQADRLALRKVSLRFLEAGLRLEREARQRIREIACPTLWMLAGRDQIIDNQATMRLAEYQTASRRTVTVYPEARHTLEFEVDRDRILLDLVHWCLSVPTLGADRATG